MRATLLYRLSRRLLVAVAAMLLAPATTFAADRAAIARDARHVYPKLLAKVPAAKALSEDAAGVLEFAKITKAGPIVGGQ